jgi:hypothetical protein
VGILSLLMTVWEVCLCGFRKEQTGAFYSSGDEFVSRSFACSYML